MISKKIYNIILYTAVFCKIFYLFLAILSRVAERNNWESTENLFHLKEYALTITDVFIYLILIILFSPHKKSIDIRVSREEQIIIFTLGILGLIHTNWNYFEKFLIEIKSLN